MSGLYFIICIAIVVGTIYGVSKRKSARKEQDEANTTFLGGNQSAADFNKPCRIRVHCCDIFESMKYGSKLKNIGYHFSLNGGEKQRVSYGGYIEFQTVSERNVLDGFGGGNGFAGSRLGMAVDSYQFKATSGGFIQLSSKPSFVARAGLAGFTETTWQNNISIHNQEEKE